MAIATSGGVQTDQALLRVMGQNGILRPRDTLAAARQVGLPLPLACAVLEKESSGGQNVFGHDGVANPIKSPQGGVLEVTKDLYLQYKEYRRKGMGMQGVGPTQLTWWELQDHADTRGGCWDWMTNAVVGFEHLRDLVKRNGLRLGGAVFNGGPHPNQTALGYGDDLVARTGKWRALLGAPGTPVPAGLLARPALAQTRRPPTPTPTGPTGADLVRLCAGQVGDPYEWGKKPSPEDADPHGFDCSGLVQWAARRLGISDFPEGTYGQEDFCRAHGATIPIERAPQIQGALLFRNVADAAHSHVVVCLGNGRGTIEAAGRRYGVIRGNVSLGSRGWTAASLVPGLHYAERHGAPAAPPSDYGDAPRWPGRYIMRGTNGEDVADWQRQMIRRGWKLRATGVYDKDSENACIAFQREKGLVADGIVGPSTWRRSWTAPVTP